MHYTVCPKFSRADPIKKKLRTEMKISTYILFEIIPAGHNTLFTKNVTVSETPLLVRIFNARQIVCRTRFNV